MSKLNLVRFLASALIAGLTFAASAVVDPFVGEWELTIPGGAAGWLGVVDQGGKLEASLLWGSGSVLPLASARVEGDHLLLTRKYEVERKDATGKKSKVEVTENFTGSLQGDRIQFMQVKPTENGQGQVKESFSGRRQPALLPAPDLAKIKFGPSIPLFNGANLDGWRLTDPKAVNGWSVKDGLLLNTHVEGKGNYGNLRTDREFEDFNLQVEVRVGKDENSGIYLRGLCEVQVADTFGRPLDSHNMGAVYSRIKPVVAAEKPPGEWQTVDITFINRYVTVVLNGKTIIANQPVLGCTGGALWSDVNRPGPIYLQGDHTGIAYRSIVLKLVITK